MARLTARNKDGTAYFPECFKEPCCGFGCQKEEACKFMEAVCEKMAVFEDRQDNRESCWKLEAQKQAAEIDRWKIEAQKQAAETGEIIISIAERLEAVRTDIAVSEQLLLDEDNELDRVILTWKVSQKKSEAEWLERVLYGKHMGAGHHIPEWKAKIMERFERME